jgi:hypothetical protein
MTQVIKTINGRKYSYNVEWDLKQKKQVWKYQGKIEEKIDPDELKKDLYSSIFKSISVRKKDRKKIITSIDKVIEKYDDYW